LFELHAAVAEEARRASNRGQSDPMALRDSLLVSLVPSKSLTKKQKQQNLWPLVRKRTIPTERPPLVDEI
jgi:hypothetical protein